MLEPHFLSRSACILSGSSLLARSTRATRSSLARLNSRFFFEPSDLRSQLADFCVELGELVLMGCFQFHCAVLFLKETWQPFQSDCSPILQLRRMDFILRGDLRKCLLFFQEFLNHFCLESGCILFSHHDLSLSYFSLFPCLNS